MEPLPNSASVPYRMSARAYWRLSPIIHEFVNTFPTPVVVDVGDMVPEVLVDRIRGVIKGQLSYCYDRDLDNVKLLDCWNRSRASVLSDTQVTIKLKGKPKLKKLFKPIKQEPVKARSISHKDIEAFCHLVSEGHLPIPVIFYPPQDMEAFAEISAKYDVIMERDKDDNIMIT